MKFDLTTYTDVRIEGLLPRDVNVWTPPQYMLKANTRFPVIYMHDGQSLFFKEKPNTDSTWGIAETITKLSSWGFITPAIVIGIDNTENRYGDYLPTKPFNTPEGQEFFAARLKSNPERFNNTHFVADKYLQLIIKKIKPQIDQDFRTLSDKKNTYIIGASMGGLISLYALVEYPEVFGAAGCFSTHWPAVGKFMRLYLQSNLPIAGNHRLYFDYGSTGGDELYAPYQKEIDQLMVEKGYRHGRDWMTRFAPEGSHTERAWRSRIHVALRFFFG